jgi:hypothetical protein
MILSKRPRKLPFNVWKGKDNYSEKREAERQTAEDTHGKDEHIA